MSKDPEENEVRHNGAPDRFVMLSGGMDSVAMAHYLMEGEWDDDWGAWNKRPVAIYLDTTVGLSSQRLYVEQLCDHYGWQLWTLRTHQEFEEHTEEQQFYGESEHTKIFNALKGRQQGKLATACGNPHFYFGTRRAESDNRSNIRRSNWREGIGAWTHNPICDWSDGRVISYLRENEVPFNPNWEVSHPTDCACGATASRGVLIELEAEGYEVFAKKLRDLEERVEGGKRDTWAWSSFSESELRAKGALDDDEQSDLSNLMCGDNCSGRSKALSAGYSTRTDGGDSGG